MSLLEVSHLVKYFPIRKGLFGKIVGYVKAVDDVSFRINENEVFALVGESGSGKTTVAKCILRLIKPTSGKIIFMNKDIFEDDRESKWYHKNVQAVFQNPFLSLNPRMRVRDIIAEPLKTHYKISDDEVDKIVYETLEKVGLAKTFAKKYPHELSGGQAQRVAIARAIVIKPKLVVLDEPTSALDVSVQAQILNLLVDLKEEFKLSYLIISHDLSVVRYISDWIAVMYLGKIVELAKTEELFEKPLHPYTQTLLSSIPEPDPESMKLKKEAVVIGEPPSAINPPTGCRYNPRCVYASRMCRDREPPLIEYEKEHWVACWLYYKK